jgi:hypothetical protein
MKVLVPSFRMVAPSLRCIERHTTGGYRGVAPGPPPVHIPKLADVEDDDHGEQPRDAEVATNSPLGLSTIGIRPGELHCHHCPWLCWVSIAPRPPQTACMY